MSERNRWPKVPHEPDWDLWVLGEGKDPLTQAQAKLPGSEEASVGLVQTFKHSLQLLRCEEQVTLQALAEKGQGE